MTEYHGADYVMDMTLPELVDLLEATRKRKTVQRKWEIWLAMIPRMEKFISFEEFCDQCGNEEEEQGYYIDQVF